MPSAWTTVAIAREDLRRFLNDGKRDRPVKEKIVIGPVDGTNKTFFTWDDRIVVEAPTTFKVTLDQEEQPDANVTLDDPILGRFTLTTAPTANTAIRARYFFQYFLDAELDEALEMAAGEMHETDDITTVAPGFKLSALHYAGSFAYGKQAMKWAQRMSSRFLLEEEPINAEVLGRSNLFRQISKDLRDTGDELRVNFYKRHGRREAPAWGTYKPRIPLVGPLR